jgi:hypothetical protein
MGHIAKRQIETGRLDVSIGDVARRRDVALFDERPERLSWKDAFTFAPIQGHFDDRGVARSLT